MQYENNFCDHATSFQLVAVTMRCYSRAFVTLMIVRRSIQLRIRMSMLYTPGLLNSKPKILQSLTTLFCKEQGYLLDLKNIVETLAPRMKGGAFQSWNNNGRNIGISNRIKCWFQHGITILKIQRGRPSKRSSIISLCTKFLESKKSYLDTCNLHFLRMYGTICLNIISFKVPVFYLKLLEIYN